MTDSRPIFIGGTDRAGKTLMSAVLSSHSRIAVPAVGSNLWTLFYQRFGSLDSDERFEQCLSALLSYSHVRYLEPDADRLRTDFKTGAPTYARLFALLLQQYAERLHKPRWGDQTGLIEGYADDVMGSYPGARMIHMLRDPRDRYDASLQLWPEGRLRVGGAVGRWLYSARLARRNAQLYPERYLVVRYEDFVREPAVATRAICEFVGEAYEPEMLLLHGMPGYRRKLLEERREPGPSQSPISDRFVGAHREGIPGRELAYLEWRAGTEMRRAGYLPAARGPSGGGLARFALLDVPLNELRLRFWAIRTALSRMLPRLAGRKPSARYLVRHAE